MPQQKATLAAASGRWPEILRDIADISEEVLASGKREIPCPACGGETRFRWDQDDGDGGWHCSHCGGKDGGGGGGTGIDLLCRLRGWSFAEAARQVDLWLAGRGGELPPFQPPRPRTQTRVTERDAFAWLEAADQIADGEVFSPSRAKGRAYSSRWRRWAAENTDAAESIVLEAETAQGASEPPAEPPIIPETRPVASPLEQARAALAAALAGDASRADLEQLVGQLAADHGQSAGTIRALLRALQQEQESAEQVAANRQRLVIAADRAEVGALLITLDELMPPSLAQAIRTRIRHLPADDVTAAGVFLSAAAGVTKLGSEIIASRSDSFSAPLNLFGALVGRSGSKKGPVEKLLLAQPIRPIREDMARQNARARQEWQEANHGAKPADRTEPPPALHAVVSQFTGESLDRQLAIQEAAGLGLLIHRDELAGLFGSLNAYRGGRGADSEQLLEAYDGQGSSSLRISADGGGRFYERCQLSIFGTIQPRVLEGLVADGDASGLWARFLFFPLPSRVVPLPAEETQDEIDASEAAAALLAHTIGAVFRLPRLSLQLSPEGRRAFMAYEARCQEDAERAELEAQCAAWSKAPGKVLRLAGLLHLLHRVSSDGEHQEQVGPEMIRRASNLTDHLTGWALGLHEAAAAGETTDLMRLIHGLAERAGEAIGWRAVLGRLSKRQRLELDSAAARAAAEALAGMGYGEIVASERGAWLYRALKPLPA